MHPVLILRILLPKVSSEPFTGTVLLYTMFLRRYTTATNVYRSLQKGGCSVKRLVESILEDRSSGDVFLFRVRCAVCGGEYGNQPRYFSKAGVQPESRSSQILFAALYERELLHARRSSIVHAAEHMNYCPVCKRLVCNSCFMICEELDLCSRCASELGQVGQAVSK